MCWKMALWCLAPVQGAQPCFWSQNLIIFCNDYHKVNPVTKPDLFPLPRMDDCVDHAGPAKYISKLDLLKGYKQVPLSPCVSEVSALVTPDHFLQYTLTPFGLRNAPAKD